MNHLLHHALEQHARTDGAREAFRDGKAGLSYAEAEERAGRIAAALHAGGVKRGDRVVLYMARGVDACLAIFGILKAGAAYVPLDPQAPRRRVESILSGVEASAVMVDSDRARALGDLTLPASLRIVVGAAPGQVPAGVEALSWDAAKGWSDRFVERATTDEDLYYIIFTSGSTGAPKGIMHTHRSALAYARWAAAEYGLQPADRLANFSPFHFDISTFDLFAARLAGAATVVVPQGVQMFPASCADLLERERISVVFTVPHALQLLSNRGRLKGRDLGALRWLIYGGEPFPPAAARALMNQLPGASLSNMYGPAEVNGVTAYHLHEAPEGSDAIPIGVPAPNVDALLLDEHGNPVGPGEPAELYIRASSRMLGYWKDLGDPERESFLDREAPGGQVQRYYRTGDIVRERSDGVLVFLGRRDQLVKVRGHRIELAEVEAALISHPAVEAAAAFTQRDDEGAVLLAAVENPRGAELDCSSLWKHVRSCLPPYAVPSRLEIVEVLPRTSTGKVDRPALQTAFPRQAVEA